MPKFQLRMRCGPREPLDDDGEGHRLRDLVVTAVGRGAAPLVGVVLRTDRTDIVALEGLKDARLAVPTFLAGMSRSTAPNAGPAEAVGLMGALPYQPRPDEPAVPLATVFLEWADCRWWMWRALIDPDARAVREGTETILRAVDGDPMPPQLGRWWSLGRRMRMDVRLGPTEPPAQADHEALVH